MERNGNHRARLRIGRHVLGALTPSQRSLLAQMLREPLQYVPHRAYRQPGAERRILPPDNGDTPLPIQRFIQALADPVGQPEDIEIPKGAVLSADEERGLFMQYNYCRFRLARLVSSTNGTPVGLNRLREMIAWFSRVLDLRDRLVNANMPLVLAMAKRTRLGNVDFCELISDGNMALLRAIDKFDVARGFKFSTYACRAILKAFSRASMKQSRYRQRFPTEFDPDMEKSDFLESKRQDVESDCVDQLRVIIRRNSAHLNEVEKVVIRERFAIDNQVGLERPRTLEEVGRLIGVTKERVRQIQNRALHKIKAALTEEVLVA